MAPEPDPALPQGLPQRARCEAPWDAAAEAGPPSPAPCADLPAPADALAAAVSELLVQCDEARPSLLAALAPAAPGGALALELPLLDGCGPTSCYIFCGTGAGSRHPRPLQRAQLRLSAPRRAGRSAARVRAGHRAAPARRQAQRGGPGRRPALPGPGAPPTPRSTSVHPSPGCETCCNQADRSAGRWHHAVWRAWYLAPAHTKLLAAPHRPRPASRRGRSARRGPRRAAGAEHVLRRAAAAQPAVGARRQPPGGGRTASVRVPAPGARPAAAALRRCAGRPGRPARPAPRAAPARGGRPGRAACGR